MSHAALSVTDIRTTSPTTSLALRQGVVAAQAREFDKARTLLQQVTAESPDDIVAWYWLAIASPSADAAIPCLRRVLAIDQSHLQAREALARLLVTEARAAAAAGRPVDARAFASEAAQLTPEAQSPWLALAALATDHVERIDALRQVVALAPEDLRLRTQLRQALLARGVMIAGVDRVEARSRFREAVDLNPLDARIWQALATLADSRDELLQSLRELVRVAPDHHRGRVALRTALIEDAQAHVQAGRTDEACERWREAIAAGGGDVESWLALAAATTDDGEAARAIEAAYELDPLDARTVAALDRLRGPQFDPATVAAPEDAFARFEAADGSLAPLELSDDATDTADSMLDAFANLPDVPAVVVKTEPIAVAPIEPVVAALIEPVVAAPIEPVVAAPIEPVVAAPIEPATPAAIVEPVEAAAIEPVPTAVIEPFATAAIAPAPTAPTEVVSAPVEVAAAPQPPAAAQAPASSARTVMVVDDSPTIRKILGLTLERAGYTVVAEPDGQAALDRLQEVVPSLILLDISMPKLDGYEVCKRIKQDPRTAGVPVIMLSGKGAFFDKVKGHMAGATEYLTKPFETPAVLAVVTSHCQAATETHHG